MTWNRHVRKGVREALNSMWMMTVTLFFGGVIILATVYGATVLQGFIGAVMAGIVTVSVIVTIVAVVFGIIEYLESREMERRCRRYRSPYNGGTL